MATCCQVLPLSCPVTISSSRQQQPRINNYNRRRNFKITTCCYANASMRNFNNNNNSFPPVDQNDPFLSTLAAVAATSPEKLYNRPSDPDTPPFLDIFNSAPTLASPAQVERVSTYEESQEPAPDLPSMILEARVVFLGMPLVPAVTELIVAELLWLQYEDPEKPIYFYINSTGTTRDDGEAVAMEYEGFAIYDTMQQLKNEIHTICVGTAMGQAVLLLAAGTKGKRSMMPNAKLMLHQPKVPSAGLTPASDVAIRSKEAVVNRDTLVKLLAEHTGKPEDFVAKVMRRPYYMHPRDAKEFGVIDKILWPGDQDRIMGEVPTEEKETDGLE